MVWERCSCLTSYKPLPDWRRVWTATAVIIPLSVSKINLMQLLEIRLWFLKNPYMQIKNKINGSGIVSKLNYYWKMSFYFWGYYDGIRRRLRIVFQLWITSNTPGSANKFWTKLSLLQQMKVPNILLKKLMILSLFTPKSMYKFRLVPTYS